MRKSFSIFQAGLCAILIFSIPFNNFSQSFIQEPLKQCGFLKTETLNKTLFASDNVSVLYLPLPNGLIKAVRVKNLETIWQSDVGGEISDSIIFDGSNLLAASIADTDGTEKDRNDETRTKKLSIQSLSATTGITQWRKEFSVSADTKHVYLLYSTKTAQLYALSEKGNLWILNKEDGETKSEENLGKSINFPVLTSDQKIYFGSSDNKIFVAANLHDVPEVSEIAGLGDQPTALHVDVNGEVFAGDKSGFVYNIQTTGAKIKWKARGGAEITSIKAYSDKLLVSSSDNYIYFLSKNTGSRIWKKRLEGKIQGELPFDKDFVIISPLGTNIATVIDLKKGKTINMVPVGEKAETSFTNNPLIMGGSVIFSTVSGFYSYSAEGCESGN